MKPDKQIESARKVIAVASRLLDILEPLTPAQRRQVLRQAAKKLGIKMPVSAGRS